MNFLLLIAAIVCSMACAGHFTIGNKDFLKPVLESQDVGIIPRKVMHSLFHYMSVWMLISAVLLWGFAFDYAFVFRSTEDVTLLIGICFLSFAMVQIPIAINSPIENGLLKMFQWIFWIIIGVCCLLSLG
ncbi:hypothetical protein [Persicobacter sp. CCB-QB2]|uniref:hypothetical protein n=1 Tax=Persicobacter sp. CCB-QB2 TaxID=1561025 RepID=UPI0012F7400B|nr:hypothetical protein [Persicobacter sp. CCB-QB2]